MVYLRFLTKFCSLKQEKDPIFDFHEIESLTVFSDNVLPAVLGHFGILRFSEKLSAHLSSGNPLPAGNEEVELRTHTHRALVLVYSSC